MFSALEFSQLMIAYTTYLLATSSPGPATLTIMNAAMTGGRWAGLTVAAGVITGSVFWGLSAAFGLASVLSLYGELLEFLRYAGGGYLLYLAWKSYKASGIAPHNASEISEKPKQSAIRNYLLGVAIHLTNPKAVFAWIAIITLGMGDAQETNQAYLVLAGCFLLGVFVFGGYAIIFSTPVMISAYRRAKKPIEVTLAAIFGAAGVKLIISPAD